MSDFNPCVVDALTNNGSLGVRVVGHASSSITFISPFMFNSLITTKYVKL